MSRLNGIPDNYFIDKTFICSPSTGIPPKVNPVSNINRINGHTVHVLSVQIDFHGVVSGIITEAQVIPFAFFTRFLGVKHKSGRVVGTNVTTEDTADISVRDYPAGIISYVSTAGMAECVSYHVATASSSGRKIIASETAPDTDGPRLVRQCFEGAYFCVPIVQ